MSTPENANGGVAVSANDASGASSPALPRPAHRRLILLTWGVTAVLMLVAFLLIFIAARRAPPVLQVPVRRLAQVETRTVVAEEYRESLVLPARLVSDRRSVVASETAGRLAEWLVAEGDAVTANQALARLNVDELEARFAQLEAQQASARQSVVVGEQRVDMARIALERAERDVVALDLDLNAARSSRDLVAREFERTKTLAASRIATQAELDVDADRLTQARLAVERVEDAIGRARLGVRAAQAQLAEATAGLELARRQVDEVGKGLAAVQVSVDKAVIRSPFAGRLDKHLVEAGDVVGSGQSLGVLHDLSHVRAVVDVADRYAPFLDERNPIIMQYIAQFMPGARQDVRARVVIPGLPKLVGGADEGISLEAVISFIGLAADRASNTFPVELRLANPGEAIREGMIVRARIDYLVYPDALVIPLRAVQVADTGPRVLVVETRDGATYASVRNIEPISIKGDRILVGAGLAVGDRIVVAGGRGVIDGEQVKVVMADGVLAMALGTAE